MCSSGSKTKTSTSSSSALPQYANAYSSILGQAQNTASTPWNPATGQSVAGFTAPQNQAFNATQSNLGAYQPYLGQASSSLSQGTLTPQSIQQFMDPYTQNVVNATQAQFNNQNAQAAQSTNANAAKIGALTGDRSQVAQGVLAGQQQLAQAPVIAGLYNQGYQTSAQTAGQAASLANQNAGLASSIGGQAQQYGQNDIASLLGIGGLQQTQQQNVLNANTANAQAQAQYPFATKQWLASLATGLGGAAGTTGSQSTPGPNIWSQLLGGGLAAASLFNRGGRVGYDSGGVVGTGMPYPNARSYVPTAQMPHGGMNHQGPMPSMADQTGGGMSDVLSNFKQAHSAFQGLGNLGSDVSNWANTSTGQASSTPTGVSIPGFATTVSPSGMSGWGNFLGFERGGMVRPHFAGGGDVTDLMDDGTGTYGMDLGSGMGGLFPGARTDSNAPGSWEPTVAPSPAPQIAQNDRWTPSVSLAPALPPQSGLGAMSEPQRPAAAPSARPMAAAYDLPKTPWLFGSKLSDPARQGLLQAGLGIMASQSPWVGSAIGEGGLAGARAYGEAKQQAIQDTQTKTRIDQEAERLKMAAAEAAQNLRIHSAQEGRAAESFPLEQAAAKQALEIPNRPKFEQIGEDEWGNKKYGPVDPKTGMPVSAVDPVTGQPVTTPTGASQSSLGSPKDIVDAIVAGKQPPTLTGLYKQGARVRAGLAKQGFDLDNAQLQWAAAQKQTQSLNGPQMVRYAGLSNSVINTIDEVNNLAKDMDNGGVPLFNGAKLSAYINAEGNSPKGQLAAKYLASINTLKEEFANLAQGGYAPTEAAWGLANQQINGNYGVKQLAASLNEVQRLLRYRLQGIPNMGTLGPGAANRYVGSGEASASGHAEPAPSAHPSQAADGAPPLPRPKDKAEYDTLPSGSHYIDPEGLTRTKP